MGLFNMFKKKNSKPVPTLKNGTVKSFDYFAFKIHGVATIPGAQEVLAKKGCDLYEQPNFVDVKLENDCLNVYINGFRIGSGDKQAKNKFEEHCKKEWNIHSCSIYGGDNDNSYGCKVRIKYFY